jgi:hypothetical protein
MVKVVLAACEGAGKENTAMPKAHKSAARAKPGEREMTSCIETTSSCCRTAQGGDGQ